MMASKVVSHFEEQAITTMYYSVDLEESGLQNECLQSLVITLKPSSCLSGMVDASRTR